MQITINLDDETIQSFDEIYGTKTEQERVERIERNIYNDVQQFSKFIRRR